MSKKVQPWPPTTIKRFVKAFPTSACTVLVETDAGKGYLKALGGPEGPHTLACEWVATQLARWFGLSTFDFAIIPVTEADEIPFHNGGKAQVGPGYVTRAESGEPWSGEDKQLDKLINPQDISRLVVFDTWTLNCDRHSWPADGRMGKARVNRNNVFLSEEAPDGQFLLKAIDHTHCFTCGRALSRNLGNIDRIRDSRVFGLFPEFRKYLERAQVKRAAIDLRRVNRAEVVRMTQRIPKEWQVDAEALDALADLIVGRAAYVADAIEAQLWPQQELGFDNAGATEQPS
ncbi:MAG TPA: HipA family kinase [Gemmataceae bacterium]|nr:HipA family kinase [Gemmataceae bacterium]